MLFFDVIDGRAFCSLLFAFVHFCSPALAFVLLITLTQTHETNLSLIAFLICQLGRKKRAERIIEEIAKIKDNGGAVHSGSILPRIGT